jgi:hypothetical protein
MMVVTMNEQFAIDYLLSDELHTGITPLHGAKKDTSAKKAERSSGVLINTDHSL